MGPTRDTVFSIALLGRKLGNRAMMGAGSPILLLLLAWLAFALAAFLAAGDVLLFLCFRLPFSIGAIKWACLLSTVAVILQIAGSTRETTKE